MSFYDALVWGFCKEQVDKPKAEGKTKMLVPVAGEVMPENTHAHTYRVIRKVDDIIPNISGVHKSESVVYEVKRFRWFRDEMTRFKKTFNHGGLQMGIIDWDYHYYERTEYYSVDAKKPQEIGLEGEVGENADLFLYPYFDSSHLWSDWTPCPEKGMILGGSRTFIKTHGIIEEGALVDRLTKHDIDAMIETLKNLRIHEAGE